VNDAIETPSGKGAGDENFPVGSWLLPRALRPHVAVFYAFARAIDDIADNPALAPADKIARLDAFGAALTGAAADQAGLEKAQRLHESLHATGITAQHGLDLIDAFKQDAVKTRYRNWGELIGYCNRSAAPVGRYLLDLHGDPASLYPGADALCNALQVINHLQDCQADYRALDRVYLPQDWLDEAGATITELDAPRASPGLRRVLNRCLDGVELLLMQARPFPAALRSRRLAMESAVILRIAERLTAELRHRDPLAERVVLKRSAFLICGLHGVLGLLFGRRGRGPARPAPLGPGRMDGSH
jgi:hydroxysqualene synthase